MFASLTDAQTSKRTIWPKRGDIALGLVCAPLASVSHLAYSSGNMKCVSELYHLYSEKNVLLEKLEKPLSQLFSKLLSLPSPSLKM